MDGRNLFDMDFNESSFSAAQHEYLVVLEDPKAIELADLVSISRDLAAAEVAVNLYHQEAKRKLPRTDRLGVFFDSAVISYGRAFASGKGSGGKAGRRKIDLLVESLDKEQQASHVEIVRFRNQHVGHRVDHAQQYAVVLAAFDRTSLQFKSISPIVMNKIDGPLMVGLDRVVHPLLTLVEKQISQEIDQLTHKYASQEHRGELKLPSALANLGGSSEPSLE